jgi:hypothetical protein
MQVDVASSYRLDDFKLVSSATAGTAIDFSQAVEKDFTAGGTQGGGEEPTPPAGGSATTIAEVLATSGTLASGTSIEAVVISNRALNNLTSKKGLYVQDATGGLQFYLAANHEFNFGDKVLIDLSGASVGEYNGAVQISGLPLENISLVSTGNTVTPKTVSVADFLANKYEGQYVAIEGVQVADADLDRTFVENDSHTSINVVTADGQTFAIFSSKYASYGSAKVPQGSGTIKGISSISKGAMQVIFAQDSDYAGLTGTRFDGTTPPSGGDQGGDQGGDDPVTPPSGDGQYDSELTWTLGANAYDVTSQTPQKAIVNGVMVENLLKLGKSSAGGDATVSIPSGTTKIGFYAVGWNKSNGTVLTCVAGSSTENLTLAANTGAVGNPDPTYEITVTDSDYFTVTIPSGTQSVVLKTTGKENCRAVIFGLKAVK